MNAVNGSGIDLDNSTLFNAATIDTIDDFSSNVTLESVSSSGAVNGIRLVNLGRSSRFNILGDASLVNPGITGGTITGATNAGVLLQNAARVSLRGMLLDDNLNGIVVTNSQMGLDLDNPDVFDDDLLQVLFTRVTASDQNGLLVDDLLSLNLSLIHI